MLIAKSELKRNSCRAEVTSRRISSCVESPRAERVGARRRTFGAVDEDGYGAFNVALQVANVLEICGSEREGDMA